MQYLCCEMQAASIISRGAIGLFAAYTAGFVAATNEGGGKMPLGECANRHMYNKDKYGDTCPICGLVSRKSMEEGKTKEEIEAMLKVPVDKYACAWLVCIDGINKGRSYPIHPGKNFLGSGDGMDIQILGDEKVDRYRHAVLAYDNKTLRTTLLPGESVGLVYLENAAVYAPKELDAYTKIEVGGSRFIFVPFCGDSYQWGGDGDKP